MTITFISNFMNHHQLPLCLEIYNRIGEGFHFVSCSPMPKARLELGYPDLNCSYDFIIRLYENVKNKQIIENLIVNSDVVIFGNSPIYFRKLRYETNKLTFYYTERLLKKGTYRRFIPMVKHRINEEFIKFQNSNTYILCSSAYTANDFNYFNVSGNTYNWGYFPELVENEAGKLLCKKNSEVIKILWVARFINWKHPEIPIIIADKLKKDKVKFQMQLIGDGIEMENCKKLYRKYGLVDNEVQLLGSMSSENVRRYMDEANIFLFTSDFREGWGAVLNEAMNSGCSVIASHAIGSAPLLIQDGVNGLLYKNGDISDLYNKVKMLIQDEEYRNKLSKNAFFTIKDLWNSKVAAERFINLSNGLMEGNNIEYKNGPCSKASILKNNWYKTYNRGY